MRGKKQTRLKPNGTCKLTGEIGKLVKSHIIPAALTKPAYEGAMLFQHGPGRRAQKRRTSWYDQSIVTQKGEDLLKEIDTVGIRILRENRLVWSGFGPMESIRLDGKFDYIDPSLIEYGFRVIQVKNPEALRKFFLSLLWRASVSNLPEMAEVRLQEDIQTQIGHYLAGEIPLPIKFYPCTMVQHPQIGLIHNQTPTAGSKSFGNEERAISYDTVRFYFDGLVLNFHFSDEENALDRFENNMTVGYSQELLVPCVPWNKSRQLEGVIFTAKESLW
ncbi:MAG: hypothetical protein WBN04_18135 [Paracoccaceae bacterium]